MYVYFSVFVLIIIALFVRFCSSLAKGKEDKVVITYQNKKEIYTITDKPQTITIDQGNNIINKIHIEKDNVYMEESTCKNQLCIAQGKMTPGNIRNRPNGRYIICLPHKLTVELIVGEDKK